LKKVGEIESGFNLLRKFNFELESKNRSFTSRMEAFEGIMHQTEIRSDRIESLMESLSTNEAMAKMVADVVMESQNLKQTVVTFGQLI